MSTARRSEASVTDRVGSEHRAVAVVGAGIGGLTVALLLARSGTRVTLIEQQEHPAALGAGIMLQPNGLAVLDGLGLASRVEGLGRRIDRMNIRNGAGDLLVSQLVPDFGDGLDRCVAVLRRDLQGVLLEAVRDHRFITLRTGVRAVAAHRDGTVQLDGPDGPETLTVDVVIGADGVRSVIRDAGDFGARVRDQDTLYVRVLVPTEEVRDFVEHWTALGAAGAAVVADGTTYVYLAAYRGEAAAALVRRDLEGLGEAWRQALPAAAQWLAQVGSFDDLIVSGVHRVRCHRWVDGRLVLLGDAAHAMAPNAGQGANSAMVDALVLAEELAGARSLSEALGRYQHRRRRKVTRIQSVADRLARLSGLQTRSVASVRDALLRVGGRSPALMERQVRGAQQENPLLLRSSARRLAGGV